MRDSGFTSVQFLVAASLALVFFAALANVVVVQYAKGALRSALDQGVRAGSMVGSPEACEERVGQVLDDLLGGAIGSTTEYCCDQAGPLITAFGSLTVESWTPLGPDYYVELVAEGATEAHAP